MTRRPVKLSIIEDDSTYLTVVHPYPQNANLQLPTDRRWLALWLACCTGKPDVLRTIFHKPKAAGMVILEVDREFERFDALLGMHSWSEFLLAPTEEETGNSSKVFYCTYHNAEAIREAGWNHVEIEDHWFQGWRLDNEALLKAPQVNEFKEDNAPTRKHSTTAVAMMAILGTVPKASSVEGSATGTPHGATAGPSTSGAIPVRDQSRANGEAAVEDNPWDGYNTARPDPPTRVKQKRGEEWICPEHGPMCIPGICAVRARVDRDERWQKEREERAENKRKWKERKERKARKREMELARAEGRELLHRDQPAEGNRDGSHDQGSLRVRTETPDPPPPSQGECTQMVISAEGEGFPMSADMGREHPIAKVQSSSAQAHGIGATSDGDGIEIDSVKIHPGKEQDKDKGNTDIALDGHGPDFEKVLLPEVPGDIGRSWCKSSVAW